MLAELRNELRKRNAKIASRKLLSYWLHFLPDGARKWNRIPADRVY